MSEALERHSAREVGGHTVEVWRILGARRYVATVDGVQLPGWFDWTVDAINAGLAQVSVLQCARRNS